MWRKRELETTSSGDHVLDHCSLVRREQLVYVDKRKSARLKGGKL
jgi:hypothetical protein